MTAAADVMVKTRYLLKLEHQSEINIAWNGTSEEMEQRFMPIRIPLRKGLLGYRLLLIRKENQSKIDQVNTISDLKKLSVGQGLGWIDGEI